MRPANIDASAGSIEEVSRIVTQIRRRWPAVRILLRADAGFARDRLMTWCEDNDVDFLFGLARNRRLVGEIDGELTAAATGKPARRFKDFACRTRDNWSRQRRVVAKAEWTEGEANPRFVVTSLRREEHEARHLKRRSIAPRGEMENRIKECQLDLYADRTSAQTMRANQRLDGLCADLCLPLHRPGRYPVHPRLLQQPAWIKNLPLFVRRAAAAWDRVVEVKETCAPACAASSSLCPRPSPTRPNTAPMPRSPQRSDEPENLATNDP